MPYLCSDPVQDVNEERTASGNSSPWLQRSAIRPNIKIHSPFLPCYCVCLDWEEWMHGLRIHPGQIRWGRSLKPLAVQPSVYGHMGCSVEMLTWLWQDWDGEEAKVLQRRAETQRRKRHRLSAALESCSTHMRRTRKVLDLCCPGSAHQPAQSFHEGDTHSHDVTQNTR